ncbi:MAG: carboxypeptidase regulatory-like domain-containing protein [Acidobacteriota bacterium]
MNSTIAVMLFVAFGANAGAQAPASRLVVNARDTTRAAVEGVAIVVTDPATGITRRSTTSRDGHAVIAPLPAGTYTLNASLTGFKTEVVRDIRLASGVEAMIAISLEPGPFSEQVVVTADAATLRIGTGAVGHVFGRETITGLPLNEREVLPVVTQAAGIAPPAPGSRLSTQGNSGIDSSGAREASNNFLLDGLDNNDLFIGRLVVNPSLDAVQEVTVLQNTYDAEYGRSAGAQVNMILRSGGRSTSGSLYEFFRNSALDARNALQPAGEPQPALTRHLFGGSIGGPLGRHDSFFFFNIEGLRARESETRLSHVPTLAERNGDFGRSGVTIVDPVSGQPFADNRVPSEQIGPVARAVMTLYPEPTRDDPAANLSATGDDDRRAGQTTVKTDHHLGAENLLSVRYSYFRDSRDLPFVARNRNLPGFGLSSLDQGQHLGIGFTSALTPRMLSVVRVGFQTSRRENLPGRAGLDGFAALGMTGPALSGNDLAYPAIVVPGYETLGDDPNLPVVRRTRTAQVVGQLTIEGVRHRVKFGGELRRYQSDGDNHLFARGRLTFSGGFTGLPLADLLLGRPSLSLIADNDNRQALRTWSAAGFIQDEWRLSRAVTLNAGVRYEYNSPPTDDANRMRIFDLASRDLVQVGTGGVPSSGLEGDFNNVAPRVGVSWDLSGHGTLIVRGGYGLFYDAGTLIENSALYFNPPYYTLKIFVPAGPEGPAYTSLANPFPTGGGFTPLPSVNTLDPHFRTGYSQQASVSIERVFRELTVAARYVTSHGDDLVRKRNINQPTPGPGPLDPRRPIPAFGDILLVESKASSTYHGLQLSVDRQLLRRFELHGAYTLSKSMDDASAFLASDGNDNTPQNSRDPDAEWGPSDFDVRHRVVASAIWHIPAVGQSAILRDWQVSAIATLQSGRPFTPRLSFDNSNTGNSGGATFASDRPKVLIGSPDPGQSTFTYNGRTFVIPPRYTFGDAGRNELTGPGYAALDVLLARRVPLSSARSLEMRLEVFNVLNRRNDQLPDSFVDRATFGESLSTYPPRQAQLAIRFSF